MLWKVEPTTPRGTEADRLQCRVFFSVICVQTCTISFKYPRCNYSKTYSLCMLKRESTQRKEHYKWEHFNISVSPKQSNGKQNFCHQLVSQILVSSCVEVLRSQQSLKLICQDISLQSQVHLNMNSHFPRPNCQCYAVR